MSDKAENFKQWCKERMNHPFEIKYALDAIEELKVENERLNQRLAEYESTPERGLKAVLGFHNAPLKVSTTCDGGGRKVNLMLRDRLLLSEYRNGIDEMATLTAEDIED